MPKDLDAATQTAASALSNPNTRPTIIIVDALNQVTYYVLMKKI